jgi:Domain of unknown function (DUF932)
MSTISTAAHQYATRPADESFPSLDALIAHSRHEKNLSAERNYSIRDLSIVPVPTDDGRGTLALRSPRGDAGMTHWAFGQFARTISAPSGYLRTLPAPIAADAMNYGIANAIVGGDVNLYVRGANGEPPVVRSCTSESYGRLHDCDLYDAAKRFVFDANSSRGDHQWIQPTAWSGEKTGIWRGDRDSFVIQVDGGSIVTDPSAGTDGTMYRGIMIRNSEVGAAAISIECVLFRYICGNLMLWGAVMDRQFRRRHVGSKVLRDVVRELGTIAQRWTNRSASEDEQIIRWLIDHDLAHTDEAVIDALRSMGATKDQAVEAMNTASRTERSSPRSYWGLAQGLTRNSQQTDYQDDRHALDKLAAIVMARGRARVAA